MSGRIPKPLQAALAAMIASMGAGGGVYLAEQERTSQLQTEYLRTVAADTSTSDAIKLAMVLGSYYESSFRHIGTPYVDKLMNLPDASFACGFLRVFVGHVDAVS